VIPAAIVQEKILAGVSLPRLDEPRLDLDLGLEV